MQLASQSIDAALQRAVAIRAVLRTSHAFVDRQEVRVVYQLRDAERVERANEVVRHLRVGGSRG